MSIKMKQKKVKALANDLNTPEDLGALSAQVMKITAEVVLLVMMLVSLNC